MRAGDEAGAAMPVHRSRQTRINLLVNYQGVISMPGVCHDKPLNKTVIIGRDGVYGNKDGEVSIHQDNRIPSNGHVFYTQPTIQKKLTGEFIPVRDPVCSIQNPAEDFFASLDSTFRLETDQRKYGVRERRARMVSTNMANAWGIWPKNGHRRRK